MDHDLSNEKENPEILKWTDIKINGNTFAFREYECSIYSYCHNAGEPKVDVESTLDGMLLEFSNFLKSSGTNWIKIK